MSGAGLGCQYNPSLYIIMCHCVVIGRLEWQINRKMLFIRMKYMKENENIFAAPACVHIFWNCSGFIDKFG